MILRCQKIDVEGETDGSKTHGRPGKIEKFSLRGREPNFADDDTMFPLRGGEDVKNEDSLASSRLVMLLHWCYHPRLASGRAGSSK